MNGYKRGLDESTQFVFDDIDMGFDSGEIVFERIGIFEHLEQALSNELSIEGLRNLVDILTQRVVPDPTELMNHTPVFENVCNVLRTTSDPETLTACLSVLIFLTHAKFNLDDNACPFVNDDVPGMVVRFCGCGEPGVRVCACRVFCNLCSDECVSEAFLELAFAVGALDVAYRLCMTEPRDRKVAFRLVGCFVNGNLPESCEVWGFVSRFGLILVESMNESYVRLVIDCLSSLVLNPICFDVLKTVPEFPDIIRTAVMSADRDTLPNLFVIVNAIIECNDTVFSDDAFMRQVVILLDQVDHMQCRPLLVFVNEMIDKHYSLMTAVHVPEKVIELAKTGFHAQKKIASGVLSHMIQAAVQIPTYSPSWLSPAFDVLTNTMPVMTSKRLTMTLDLIHECLERDPVRFVPLLRHSGADDVLHDIYVDSLSEDVRERCELLHARFATAT